MTDQESRFCSVGQAADLLGISPRAVLHRITKEQIKAQKVGDGRTSAYVIERSEIDRIKAEEQAA